MSHLYDHIDLSTLAGRLGSMQIDIAEDGSSYRCERVFGAPPERVFRAFTEPEDLRVWFPAGAPPGSEMIECESNPVEGGRYRYVMTIPDLGAMAWHGTYTAVDRPDSLAADEWFVMGGGEPTGPPAAQTLTFAPLDGGRSLMTMTVVLGEPEDPATLREQTGSGLGTSLAAMDELISG